MFEIDSIKFLFFYYLSLKLLYYILKKNKLHINKDKMVKKLKWFHKDNNNKTIIEELTVWPNDKLQIKKGGYNKPKPASIKTTIFPLIQRQQYHKYKEELMEKEKKTKDKNKDPCEEVKKKMDIQEINFHTHQKFVAEYMKNNDSLLLYHGLGTGKTCTALNILNELFSMSGVNWNVFLIIPASLRKDPWEKELGICLNKAFRSNSSIHFIHYNSPIANEEFLNKVNLIQAKYPENKNCFFIDEVHNFIGNVYNNITGGLSIRVKQIYDYIMKEKSSNGAKVIAMSGTPLVNKTFEVALLFNLLEPNLFPNTENSFNSMFIYGNELKSDKIFTFQSRIQGLVSYYVAVNSIRYATQKTHFVYCEMKGVQLDIYDELNALEMKSKSTRESLMSSAGDMYKAYTRQASNFAFPEVNKNINGSSRPRPKMYNASLEDLKGKSYDEKVKAKADYRNAQLLFIKETKKFFEKLYAEDVKNNFTIQNEIDICKKTYNGDVDAFFSQSKHKIKSKALLFMFESSCKMVKVCFLLEFTPSLAMFYSSYVKMEGLEIFAVYLEIFGYKEFKDTPEQRKRIADIKNSKNKTKYYTTYTQDVSNDQREFRRKTFNLPENKYGDIIKVILLGPSAIEGISLRNVRQVHILEPYWQEIAIIQAVGRAIRDCSHSDLPMKERHVDIYRYISIINREFKEQSKNNDQKDKTKIIKQESTDQMIVQLAKNKDNLLKGFRDAIKSAAIDCWLFKQDNSSESQNCFVFDIDSQFRQIKPAYNHDIDININIDENILSEKWKLYEITAIFIRPKTKYRNEKKSNPVKVWYHTDTQTVFHYHYPIAIGSIELIQGLPEIDPESNHFIIRNAIPELDFNLINY